MSDVVDAAITQRLSGVYTAIPGTVVAYDASKQSVDVQPALYGSYTNEAGDLTSERRPLITGCPVSFPGGGSWSFTWPVSAGDTGLLVFCSGSIDKWLALGGEVDPGFTQQHHISDAVFVPGTRSFATPISGGAPTDAMVLAASLLKLGNDNAAEQAILGTSFGTGLKAFLMSLTTFTTALGTFASACTTVPPSGGPTTPYPILALAITALDTAIGSFSNGVSSFQSETVKVAS